MVSGSEPSAVANWLGRNLVPRILTDY